MSLSQNVQCNGFSHFPSSLIGADARNTALIASATTSGMIKMDHQFSTLKVMIGKAIKNPETFVSTVTPQSPKSAILTTGALFLMTPVSGLASDRPK
jgi:hypothetical protein